MPSLRRTISTPSVRSSPYPSSLGVGTARGGHGPRRSSGSDVASRRVLADIEWWRVMDGQQDPEPEHDANENEEADAAADPSTPQEAARSPAETFSDALADLVAGPTTIATELVLQQSSTFDSFNIPRPTSIALDDSQSPFSLFTDIRPRTPIRHSREASGASSTSSAESSPQSLRTPRDSYSFTFADLGFADPSTGAGVDNSPSLNSPVRPASLAALKSRSFAGFGSSKVFDDGFDFPAHEPVHEDLFA